MGKMPWNLAFEGPVHPANRTCGPSWDACRPGLGRKAVVQPPPDPNFCEFHGIFPHERKTPWEFLVETDLRRAAVIRTRHDLWLADHPPHTMWHGASVHSRARPGPAPSSHARGASQSGRDRPLHPRSVHPRMKTVASPCTSGRRGAHGPGERAKITTSGALWAPATKKNRSQRAAPSRRARAVPKNRAPVDGAP